MATKFGLGLGLLLMLALVASVAQADGMKELVLSHLDGKGTVDSIDATNNKIVIADKLYVLSDNVAVFDSIHRQNISVDDIKSGNRVGFRSKPLSKPTAPYDQVIVRLWVLPTSNH